LKIITVTLNPCIDMAFYVNTIKLGALNRAQNCVSSVGSKGINVSRVLKMLGDQTIAIAFAGGIDGDRLSAYLDIENIEYEFVKTAANVRTNVKIIEDNGIYTEFNQSGGPINADEKEKMLKQIYKASADADVLFLGGSVPPGVDKDIYAEIIKEVKKTAPHLKVILDCDGEALEKGLKEKPALIKPNQYELSTLCGKTVETVEEIEKESLKIYEKYNTAVLATMGADGAVYTGEEGTFKVKAPKIKAKSAAGAGDTFLSAFLHYKWKRTNDGEKNPQKIVENALIFAASAAAAKVEKEGTDIPTVDEMKKYI